MIKDNKELLFYLKKLSELCSQHLYKKTSVAIKMSMLDMVTYINSYVHLLVQEKSVENQNMINEFCQLCDGTGDFASLRQMQVTDIDYDTVFKVLTVTLVYPGTLIGSGGKHIDALVKALEMKQIAIIEKKFIKHAV